MKQLSYNDLIQLNATIEAPITREEKIMYNALKNAILKTQMNQYQENSICPMCGNYRCEIHNNCVRNNY